MATRFIFSPYSAEFPLASFPQIRSVNERPVLAFDSAADEWCYWTARAPVGLTTPISIVVGYIASVNSGTFGFKGAIEAISDGDATDMDATTSFDTDNTASPVTVPGTAGYYDQVSLTLTNNDSIVAGDYFRIKLTRDTAADSAAGDVYVTDVEFKDDA